MFATIVSINYYDSPDLISINTHTDHHTKIANYGCNVSSRMTSFDLAATPCLECKSKPLNAFESIKATLTVTFKEDPLETNFWEKSTISSPCSVYRTDAANEGGGLDTNYPVFGQPWMRYLGAHSWLPCHLEKPCHCEDRNCTVTHSTVRHVAAAATTARSFEFHK